MEKENPGSVAGRNVNLDLIRVMSVFFVIIIHSQNKPWQNHALVTAVITILTFSCNALFYLISGRFNLSYEFSEMKDYIRYYRKRLISVFLPYVLVSMLLSIWDMARAQTPWTEYVSVTWSAFFCDNANTQLWFMYPLLGMILSTPFLSRLFHAMSDQELKFMAVLSLGICFIKVYLVSDLGFSFSYSGWILTGWMFNFCAGYFCLRTINQTNKKKIYLLGLAGFLISVINYRFFPEHKSYVTDLAPAFCLYYIGLYTFLEREIVIKSRFFSKLLLFIVRYSYVMYLVEWNIQRYVTPKLVGDGTGILSYVAGIVVTFALSLAVSVVLNTVLLHPLQRKLTSVLLK